MLTFGRRTNRVWDQRRALSWLERFDVPLGRRCGRLSGGQRAQVALAVALGGCPGVLLLDEPLANLDPVARTEVTEELLASHLRLTGPRADLPPCPGEIVQAQDTERQSTFIVRLPGQPVPPAVAPGGAVRR